jgi:hypothetical protein
VIRSGTLVFLLVGALTGGMSSAAVASEPYAGRGSASTGYVRGFWGDQRGCYWQRGQRFCSRYCYWEIDGQRYCQDRERVARPQGNPYFVPYPPEPPIYFAPYRRPR